MSLEIIDFLVPQNDPIQVIFAILIFGVALITIMAVRKQANPENWSKNWYGGTDDNTADDLDAEHGSVTDISHAVATASEKLAEIMPGILLIFGLLGTFLGLGMALDKASTILNAANAAGGMDGAMNDLMGMMQGLGTKFKTSTWGIIAFLGLKAWTSWNGFEEKRLRWCVSKMKTNLDHGRKLLKEAEKQENDRLIHAVEKLGQNLCLTVKEEASNTDSLLKVLAATSTYSKQQLEKLNVTLAQQLEQTEALKTHTMATRVALENFVAANASNIESMKSSSAKMAEAALNVGSSASDLRGAIQLFKDNVAEVLGVLKTDLSDTISSMSASFGSNMGDISRELSAATGSIKIAVDGLSANVGETMARVEQSISKSVDIQSRAHGEFLLTSETLNTQVTEMTNLVKDLRERITSGLKAVSESGQRMNSLSKRYEDITESSAQSAEAIKQLVQQAAASVPDNKRAQDDRAKLVYLLEQSSSAIQLVVKQTAGVVSDNHKANSDRERAVILLEQLNQRLLSSLTPPAAVVPN